LTHLELSANLLPKTTGVVLKVVLLRAESFWIN